jgi:hypothetical protein
MELDEAIPWWIGMSRIVFLSLATICGRLLFYYIDSDTSCCRGGFIGEIMLFVLFVRHLWFASKERGNSIMYLMATVVVGTYILIVIDTKTCA